MHEDENNNILKKYLELVEKLKIYIAMLPTVKPINIVEVSTKYRGRAGVYIFSSNGQAVYVGSTSDIYRRLTNLWKNLGKSGHRHVFGRKIMKEFSDIDEARKYLKSLELKIIETEDIGVARTLEQILIYLLKPKYNSYTAS